MSRAGLKVKSHPWHTEYAPASYCPFSWSLYYTTIQASCLGINFPACLPPLSAQLPLQGTIPGTNSFTLQLKVVSVPDKLLGPSSHWRLVFAVL